MSKDNWGDAPFLERALGIVPSVIYVFNQKTQSNEYSNRSLADMLGYTSQEAKEMGEELLPRLCHPDDLSKIGEHFSDILELKDGDVCSIEYRIRHKRGHWVWLLSKDSVFERESDGSVASHIGIATDISNQKEAESAAVTSQINAEHAMLEHRTLSEFLTQIMDTAKSAIIALGVDGRVLSINSTGRHFLGGLTQKVPFVWPEGANFIDRETLQPFEPAKNPVATSLAGASLNGEIYLMTNAGGLEDRYIRISSSPVDAEESAVKCVLILDDVSEQEKNRQQVERTSRLDALGQLTGGIAHDFNNLLSTVQYSLDLAQTENTTARHAYLETAKQSVARGADLTKRLLAFAKQQPGVSTSNEVDNIISEFRKLCAPLIEATIEIEYVTQEKDLWVYCDTGQLGNALLNLVLNARDAILRSGVGDKITILVRPINELHVDATLRREQSNTYVAKGLYGENSVERADNSAFRYIEFAVTDNGPGMTDEVKRRAIDPFFTTKETNSGTGLGLSMVYGFIQQANGELRIYSEVEQGTTIRMLLPRGTTAGTREKALTREEIVKGQGEKILVVEDEVRLAIVLRDLIKSLGYTVQTAGNGTEALAILDRDDGFDLVITDIVMPGGLSGFQLAEEIRGRLPDMPLIYMSGYTAYSDEDMGKVVAPMLQKPCPQSELAVAIRQAIGSKA